MEDFFAKQLVKVKFTSDEEEVPSVAPHRAPLADTIQFPAAHAPAPCPRPALSAIFCYSDPSPPARSPQAKFKGSLDYFKGGYDSEEDFAALDKALAAKEAPGADRL